MLQFIILLIGNSIFYIHAAELPHFIRPCPKMAGHDDILQDCIVSQTKTVVEALKQGVPELDIPPIDPLRFDYLPMSLHDDFAFSLNNFSVIGMSNCSFNRVLVNITLQELQMSVHFRKIAIDGSYKAQGFIFIVQADSSGLTSMIFDDVIINVKLPLKSIERNSMSYLLLPRTFDAGLAFSSVTVQFDNLFPDEPVLGTILNKFINDNADDLYQVMRPGIIDAVKQAIHKLFFKLFGNVPMHEIFAEEKQE